MTTAVQAPAVPAPRSASRPLPTGNRRPGLVALAVLLIVGFGLSGALLVSRAGDTTDVLVVARAVPAGHVIESGDVAVAHIAGSVRAIAATERASVVGRTASVAVVEGQLLNRDMLSDAVVPAKDQAVVGLSLAPGQFPADGLAVGDRVLAVVVPTATDATSTSARAITTAEVFGMRPDPTRGPDTLITPVLPLEFAGQVLANSSAGRIGLVKVTAR
jgi:hypothetical protein